MPYPLLTLYIFINSVDFVCTCMYTKDSKVNKSKQMNNYQVWSWGKTEGEVKVWGNYDNLAEAKEYVMTLGDRNILASIKRTK